MLCWYGFVYKECQDIGKCGHKPKLSALALKAIIISV